MTEATGTIEKFHGLTIDRLIDADKLVADLAINDLNDAFLTQAGLMAFYGMLAARATGQMVEIKVVRDTTEAKVATEIRERAAENKEKVTEGIIKERLDTDPRVIAVNKAYALAQQIEAEAKAAVEAMRHRKDMVVQMGAASREEAKGSLRMSVTSPEVSDRAKELKDRLARKS